jgi:hypothetical protein
MKKLTLSILAIVLGAAVALAAVKGKPNLAPHDAPPPDCQILICGGNGGN